MGFAKQNLDFNKNEDEMKLKISKLKKKLQIIQKGGGDAKIKKHHQQQLDNLIGGKSEVELQQVYDLFLNYEEELKIRIGDFEKFISSKLTNNFFKELRSYNLEKKKRDKLKLSLLTLE